MSVIIYIYICDIISYIYIYHIYHHYYYYDYVYIYTIFHGFWFLSSLYELPFGKCILWQLAVHPLDPLTDDS